LQLVERRAVGDEEVGDLVGLGHLVGHGHRDRFGTGRG
jgi:hypothetical protein